MEYFNIYADAKQSALEIRSNTPTCTRAIVPKHFDYFVRGWEIMDVLSFIIISIVITSVQK